jgi:plastocyanin domain-containing protein
MNVNMLDFGLFRALKRLCSDPKRYIVCFLGMNKMVEENTNVLTIRKKDLWRYSTFILGAIIFLGFLFFMSKGTTGEVIGGPGEIVEVKTVLQGFKYSPDSITVKEGSKVRLTIENRDNVNHGLHLPQFGIVEGQPPLGVKTVEFVAREIPNNGQAVPTCSQEHGETLTFNVI